MTVNELLIFFIAGKWPEPSTVSSLFVGLRYAPASSKTRNGGKNKSLKV